RLALATRRAISKRLEGAAIDDIHIATEGPVGLAARRHCLRAKRSFTTSYHTRFPKYIGSRTKIPEAITYALLRRFHNAGAGVMVSTSTLADDLGKRGFQRLMHWSRGVDHRQFTPAKAAAFDLPRPIFLYPGRLAPEKNVEAFLELDLPGSKVVVGDGPSRRALQASYPRAHFLGTLIGDALAVRYASADVFVFPSRTDTFGMVLIEALASGLPVAAFPVPGPLDVIGGAKVGFLDEDLASAARRALAVSPEICRDYALQFSWRRSAKQFLANLQPFA